jgi:hypothetical protein
MTSLSDAPAEHDSFVKIPKTGLRAPGGQRLATSGPRRFSVGAQFDLDGLSPAWLRAAPRGCRSAAAGVIE